MKKKLYVFAGIFGIFLLCAVIHFFRMPNLTIVYDYKGNAYTQNVRSPFRKKIKLDGYTNITYVTPNEKGYFCYAKDENGNGCFLSVENNEVKAMIPEEHKYSLIQYTAVYDNCFFIEYYYRDVDNSDNTGVYLLIDFVKKEIYSHDRSNMTVSSGEALWWVNDEHMICKFEKGAYNEIAEADWIIGIQNNHLIFYKADIIYQIDVFTDEVSVCEYKVDFHEYNDIYFEWIHQFPGDYFIGCIYSFLDQYLPIPFLTHTHVINVNTGKSILLFSSIGKPYENLKIIEE